MITATNYARMLGFGDLPGDSSNPNSPDYDTTHDEAVEARVDLICSDDAERMRYADEFAYASEPVSVRDVSGKFVTVEPNALWCAWLDARCEREIEKESQA